MSNNDLTPDAQSFLAEGCKDPNAERLTGERHRAAIQELRARGFIGYVPAQVGTAIIEVLAVTDEGKRFYDQELSS